MAFERSDLDGTSVWILTHPSGARLTIARPGGLALSWQVPSADGTLIELLDGYRTGAELAELDGYRNAVLAPWSNRVRDGRYTWNGVERDLEPGKTEQREALHGLVADAPWEEADIAGSAQPAEPTEPTDIEGAALTLVTAVEPSPGYPFPVQLRLTYWLDVDEDGAHRLSFDLGALNTGNDPAPVALGWHPYVQLPGHETIDDLELRVPARTQVRTNDALIPPPGEEAFVPAEEGALVPVGGQVIDTAYTHLESDDDGVVRTVLSSPRTGASITLEQEPSSRIVHVFTGDILARDRRASIAIEPCQLMTDALNRPECAEAIALVPGQARSLRAALVYRS